MTKEYRETLVKAVAELDCFLYDMNDNIVNLVMKGDFAEIDTLFKDGDVLTFNISDFENVEDQNVQKLIALYYKVKEVSQSIRNINAITTEETDSYDDLPF